ncbi:thiol-disulfide isomerase/thioredoxin [Pedobacter africanus]|uniref:Thiol-disulfide isomerase/thioredoxin n=1 Tax=Pedobacter africanus TaxID=151894 RepID=A0ACC6KZI6_9SPHI|nr:TlpA disulfide reductase family protein [Pedobacter africanus]MDR6784486.1 thiol-disulfide isomerase/thioredoxin [Pedobacter africanus]
MMKHNFLSVILLIALPIVVNAQNTDFTLNGQIKGIRGGVVEINRYDSKTRTSSPVTTAKLINGKFVAKGKVNGPQMLGLVVKPGNWGTQVFIDGGNAFVQMDTIGSEHYDYTAYGMDKGARLKAVKVSGSAGHADYMQYEKAISAEKNRSKINETQLGFIKPYINQKPSSVAGVYMLSQHYMFNSQMPLTELEGMLAKFKGAAAQSLYYGNLQQEVAERKAILPGNLAEDFTLLKPDSTEFTLSSTRGKYVMLDFWASWCKPCREAIPHWKEVYARYKDKGFEIVGITNDNRWNLWKKAMEEEKMDWIQVADDFPVKNMPARIASRFKSPTIPQYVLLDKEGRILVVTNHKEDIDRKLNELF